MAIQNPTETNRSGLPSVSNILLFTTQNGQTIYDVCIQTYGTLDYLCKLIEDNQAALTSLNDYLLPGTTLTWDSSLATNNSFYGTYQRYNQNLATGITPDEWDSYDNGFLLQENEAEILQESGDGILL